MKISIDRAHVPSTVLNVEVISDHSGKPSAFILPGGPGADLTTYSRYTCLQDVTDLVFHDPRGCGKSHKEDAASYNMENYINDVEDIRHYLGLSKITVIGKSYGSMCALGYTLRYPDVVSKLVLAAGAPSYRFLARAQQNIKRLGTPEQIKITEKLFAGKIKNKEELLSYFQLTNRLYALSAANNPEKFDLKSKIRHFSHEVLNEGFSREFWHFDYEKDLQNINCPTLILAGRHDWINDVSFAEFMAQHIPRSKLVIFEKSSHSMESDETEAFFKAIRDFISQ